MNTGTMLDRTMGTTQTFTLPRGWTHRKIATALAREWLTPLRPEAAGKPLRWIDHWKLQPILEAPEDGHPLWEKGIDTAEYERRLDDPDLAWTVQARAGRTKGAPKGLVLARLTINPTRPGTFDLVCLQETLPETLFEADKLAALGCTGAEGLFTHLLLDHGFGGATQN